MTYVREREEPPEGHRRLFIGVPLTDDARGRIDSLMDRLREALEAERDATSRGSIHRRNRHGLEPRWVRTEGLHLTVRFLGWVDGGAVPSLETLVRSVALATTPFVISIAGGGAFPNPSRPRVLWVGVADGADQLATVAERLDGGLVRLGWEPEGRPFRAHLTIARTDGIPDARLAASRLADLAGHLEIRFPADRLVLFESHLGGGRARYEEILSVPFALEVAPASAPPVAGWAPD